MPPLVGMAAMGTINAMPVCLICGATSNITVEHIIPQTLWKRFGVDPDTDVGDVPKTRTYLCRACNQATSSLHRRQELMSLIETGAPVTATTLNHLADWVFWVTLLLGLARGSGVIPSSEAQKLLADRFANPAPRGGIAKGVRIYAVGVSAVVPSVPRATVGYAIARPGDQSICFDENGRPVGFTASFGQNLQAAQCIRLGRVLTLVVAPTLSSGRGHFDRLGAAVATVGLERIHPLRDPLPRLLQQNVDLDAVCNLFVTEPLGHEWSLLPSELRDLLETISPRP